MNPNESHKSSTRVNAWYEPTYSLSLGMLCVTICKCMYCMVLAGPSVAMARRSRASSIFH